MNRATNEHPEWTDRLSDFMDGTLPPGEHASVEAHLAECGGCRQVLEELREVTARAAQLGPVEPSRDLWGGIAATIAAPTERPGSAASGGFRHDTAPSDATRESTRVIRLPTAGARTGELDEARAPRRFSLSSRQLVAASVVLVAASSWLTFLSLRSSPPTASADVPAVEGVIRPVARSAPPPDLARDLAAMEAVLSEARGKLDPNTVRVLERNLGIIEQAIEDSLRALEQDPENDFLNEHLRRVYERKLEYLREAARVAERSG